MKRFALTYLGVLVGMAAIFGAIALIGAAACRLDSHCTDASAIGEWMSRSGAIAVLAITAALVVAFFTLLAMES